MGPTHNYWWALREAARTTTVQTCFTKKLTLLLLLLLLWHHSHDKNAKFLAELVIRKQKAASLKRWELRYGSAVLARPANWTQSTLPRTSDVRRTSPSHQVLSLRTADSAGAAEESKAWECRHTD